MRDVCVCPTQPPMYIHTDRGRLRQPLHEQQHLMSQVRLHQPLAMLLLSCRTDLCHLASFDCQTQNFQKWIFGLFNVACRWVQTLGHVHTSLFKCVCVQTHPHTPQSFHNTHTYSVYDISEQQVICCHSDNICCHRHHHMHSLAQTQACVYQLTQYL